MSRAPIEAALAIALLAIPAGVQAAPADDVSEARLRADVERLVSFGTRHTLSSQTDRKRGIGAARAWAAKELERVAKACGGCITVSLPERTVTGERIPQPARIVNVVAVQRGTERPDEVVIVQAHIDSRASDVMDAASDAPGANDDGSGSALVLEAARVLSRHRYPVTIVYALLTGEEQGLFGGKLLADHAAAQGWRVKAVLNNDIVGNSCGSDGMCDAEHVRVFSEGPRADGTDALRGSARRFGGENDSPSRNLSRWIAGLPRADAKGLAVRQVWRADRMGRGGDHLPFQEKGYPAVRFSVAVEDYEHQHQDLRNEDGVRYGDTIDEMDFGYLAKVTRLNVAALAGLASTPAPPAPKAEAAVQTFTSLSWQPVAGASRYNVYRRRTDEPYWQEPVETTERTSSTLTGVRGDDWLFGVSSVSEDGGESPVASAVPGGAFAPLAGE